MTLPAQVFRDRASDLKATLHGAHRFRGELAGHWRALLGALLCSLAYAGVRLAEPWPLKFIFDNVLADMPLDTPVAWIDRMLGGDRMRILIAATIAILTLALLRGVFAYYQKVLTSVVGQRVALSIREQLFAHMQRLSLRFHTSSKTGDLLTRLTSDINLLREAVVGSLVALFAEGLVVVGLVVLMFLMEWRLALVAVLVIPILFGLLTVYSSRIRIATRKQRRREGELAARLGEALSGIHLVQMFAREDEEDARLRSMNRKSFRSGLRADRLGARLSRTVELLVGLATGATVFLGATQVIAGRLTPGELIVFVAYQQSFYRPIRRISRTTQRASRASSSLERITNVLDQTSDVRDGSRPAPAFRGEIVVQGAEFSYTPGVPVLRDVNVLVEAGQTVALVGPTGAGKTTLLGLIPRLHDPTAGIVGIDGLDVRMFTLKSLREQISIVPQDGMLFAATIRENIAYGKPGATDAEIEAAARAALIDEFVQELPDGYESMVGERGVSLSGGQRQQIAIARALVKDAPILLLDEPMTGLDAESEALVARALDRLFAGRTALVIAHRLSTVRRADLILVVDGGRIVERGPHEELMAHGGRYRTLYDLQLSRERSGERDGAPARRRRAGARARWELWRSG